MIEQQYNYRSLRNALMANSQKVLIIYCCDFLSGNIFHASMIICQPLLFFFSLRKKLPYVVTRDVCPSVCPSARQSVRLSVVCRNNFGTRF